MSRVEQFELAIEPLEQSPRTIFVYLPDSYDTSDKVYPVMYMFDGHNLFFDEVATYGKSWGLKKYLDRHHLDLVVVGQDCNHNGNGRLVEYAPYSFKDSHFGEIEGLGELTAKWFAEVLKPEIEQRYRVHHEREHVAIGGSSMGGLMSLYCISRYNHVFSKAACLSSSVKFCAQQMLELFEETEYDPNTKIYFDYGGKELRTKAQLASLMDLFSRFHEIFLYKRIISFPRLIADGTHTESSWEKQIPTFLPFLFEDEIESE